MSLAAVPDRVELQEDYARPKPLDPAAYGLRQGTRWAIEDGNGASAVKLYGLAAGIGGTTDPSVEYPDRVQALQAAWAAWDKSNVAPP